MDRVSIYEYDRKNRERVVKAIEEAGGQILSWSFFAKDQSKFELPPGTLSVFIDLSSLFYNEDRADALIAPAELLLNIIQQEQSVALYVIIERQYSKQARDLLYYKIDEVLDLEDFLEIEKDPIQNIVDIDQSDFENVLAYLNQNLFGNELFKKRLKEELTKYRLFNRIGQQPIFSVLICGASGIGKTEVARLLHQKLAADEPMIKINFGNYSAQDALNSLIGSPRGYIGSNKGELPDKLMRSRSKVILIDEFEKASKAVYNFFLQLLEEGKFTDSLGREYDLDKYIIIFTSNMPKERIGEFLAPELRSRFSYKCAFWPLSTQEKEQYVAFKSEHYVQLERIIHGNHSEDAQKCFREVTKAADCAINLCYFFENWKEKDITDNKYVTDYYKKYKSALWARAMFLNIQESKLNMILYKNMSLDEIRKELNPEKKDNVN